MGQTVGFRVRAHGRRWVAVVMIVSALCVLHPLACPLFNPRPTGETAGYFQHGHNSYAWWLWTAPGRDLALARVAGTLRDANPDLENLSPGRPPAWAPMHDLVIATRAGDMNASAQAHVYGYGFPFVASRSGYLWLAGGGTRSIGIDRVPGSPIDEPWPTWVYWPGMIGNLLVWNAAALAVFVGLDAIIGLRRIRRGRCVRCGYDIGVGAAFCPECGAGAGSPAEP